MTKLRTQVSPTKEKSKAFDGVVVKGARENNLKDIHLKIPRNKITVITGLSGSGKSTIAFDTIYAEGQRRYVESLSAYARNFMEQLKKPEVDAISGLSPSIAIDQKSISNNPRSTVGTVTEIYDYLRLLYSRVGVPNCPTHNTPVQSQTPEQIVDEIFKLKKGTKFFILSPVAQDKKGEFGAEFRKWSQKGFVRAKVDGEWVELDKVSKLAKHKRHNIELLVDRLVVDEKYRARLKESVNMSLSLASGLVVIEPVGKSGQLYSIHNACPECGYSFPELEPRMFSFNNPRGACTECDGLGIVEYEYEYEDESDEEEDGLDEYSIETCEACDGQRLKPSGLNVFIDGKNISELANLSCRRLLEFCESLELKEREALIAEKILKQITSRLEYMKRVGTAYLSLNRPTRTLSGGEVQRIRLATQVGSALVGVLYVLDEPSIGLHPRDHHRLLEILQEIRGRGNTIVLVEHDEDTIRSADHIIDIGPRAGALGGEIVALGTPKEIESNKKSLTGQYLSGSLTVPIPGSRRPGNGQFLEIKKASGNNLQEVDLKIPLGSFVGVTGVSGSGKSTLVIDTLYRTLAQKLYKSQRVPAPHKSIHGIENIDKVIEINQKPIGRTPRSTPATYIGLFSLIRSLYANLPESKIRGHKPGHFSFNVKGGRCEACQGGGAVKVEMHFLSDVYVKCETCHGLRYNAEARNIKFKGKSIADVLQMTVAEALEFFVNHKHIHKKLETLHRVGLDYLTLGQSSTTLSGGEAQRIKLSRELSKRGTGKTLYILDEPTTGLHFEDIRKLVDLLQELTDQGNTVLVIEHNLDVIKCCDHLIDLGPDGGDLGGKIVMQGTPEELLKVKASETGQYLKRVFP